MFVEMEEKNQLVIGYVNQIKNNFEKSGNPVSEETVRNVINRYIDSNKSFEEIKQYEDIEVLTNENVLPSVQKFKEKLEEIRKRLEFLANMEKM